ncbi:MAG: proton-translocating transhydrogenase family protein [Pseudomonadota bacterium]
MSEQNLEQAQETADQAAEAAAAAAQAAQQSAEASAEAAEAANRAAEAAESLTGQLMSIAGGSPISEFVFLATIFVLAIFVGYYVVWSVTPALHTPLMSVTNAVSSVVIVGALIAVGVDVASAASAANATWAKGLGFVAVALASVNIFGGFLVTQRMLAMYKKKER